MEGIERYSAEAARGRAGPGRHGGHARRGRTPVDPRELILPIYTMMRLKDMPIAWIEGKDIANGRTHHGSGECGLPSVQFDGRPVPVPYQHQRAGVREHAAGGDVAWFVRGHREGRLVPVGGEKKGDLGHLDRRGERVIEGDPGAVHLQGDRGSPEGSHQRHRHAGHSGRGGRCPAAGRGTAHARDRGASITQGGGVEGVDRGGPEQADPDPRGPGGCGHGRRQPEAGLRTGEAHEPAMVRESRFEQEHRGHGEHRQRRHRGEHRRDRSAGSRRSD